MIAKIQLLIHFFVTLAKLIRPGGVKTVVAENLLLKQQLMTLTRQRTRSPGLTIFDRFMFGYLAFFISKERLQKIAVSLKPATILKFHQALVKRKYRDLYSRKTRIKPGRKEPKQNLVELAVEMKRRNLRFGYGRIAMQIYKEFGINISRFAVARILRQNFKKLPDNDGPSWLTFMGHAKDSLWSVDLFRCESATLRSHWVMLVIDIYSRRIIGFAVHTGNPNSIAVCCMFNKIIVGKSLPKYLSSDNETRAHSSLNKKTPNQKAANDDIPNEVLSLRNHRWESYCHGLLNLPVAA